VGSRKVLALPVLLLAACTVVSNTQQTVAAASSAGESHVAAFQQAIPAAQAVFASRAADIKKATADIDPLPEMNRTYSGTVPMIGRNIPLPAGAWTTIETDRKIYRAGPPTGGVMLMRHDGNVLTGLIEIQGNTLPREGVTYPVNPFCAMSDVISSDVRAAEPGGRQDCAMITFSRTATWQDNMAPPALRAVSKGFDSFGVTLPPVLITAGFFVSNPRYSLAEVVWLNPDIDGIAQDLSTQRSQSDWASFNLGRDPRKQAYVDRVKAWSTQWRAVVKAEVDGARPVLSAEAMTTP
jgi:hypothetical protein